MTALFDTQIIFQTEFLVLLGEIRFAGIGFFLSLILLWIFIQILVFLAERYSRMISSTEWWKSGILALTGMLVYFYSWQIPEMMGGEGKVTTAMTSSLICGSLVAWIISGRLYDLEFLHRLVVAVGVPVFVYCAIALGKVLEWKMTGP